jgi:Zn-dependent M28 family amino/carboxypeptidase
LAANGIRPAFQSIRLTGVTTQPASRLEAAGTIFALGKDFAGVTETRQPRIPLDHEMIFLGHGINAPEFQWNDYQGISVKDKIAVVFTNEPSSPDPKFFDGRALTYYGRWSYKFEQAARMGAAGVLIIHTRPTAGYDWDVVRSGWGGEQPQAVSTVLKFAGWLQQDAGAKLLALAGHDIEPLLKRAGSRGFRPIPLKLNLKGVIESKFRPIETRNVAGWIPGADPQSGGVIYTAHWDHLGVEGAAIYNGAVDNATGCAMLLEMARLWNATEPKPRRGALFLFTAAEEAGLLGSESYLLDPIIPLGKTSLVLNFDSFYPFGRTRDLVLTGAEKTRYWPDIQWLASQYSFGITPDAKPEQGYFFRSDHFPFHKAGIPAFSVNQGATFVARDAEKQILLREYAEKHYHQPADDYSPDWDFSAMEEIARFGLRLGQLAANATASAPGRK